MTGQEERLSTTRGGNSYGTIDNHSAMNCNDVQSSGEDLEADFMMARIQCPPLFQCVALEWAHKQAFYEDQLQQLQGQLRHVSDDRDCKDRWIKELQAKVNDGVMDGITFAVVIAILHICGLGFGLLWYSLLRGKTQGDGNDWTRKTALKSALYGMIGFPTLVVRVIMAYHNITKPPHRLPTIMPENPVSWCYAVTQVIGFGFGMWYGVHTWGWHWKILLPALNHGFLVFPYFVHLLRLVYHCVTGGGTFCSTTRQH